ncbi:MAG: hypothetical protein DWQ04_32560 [Chloroflexi bacterium]|nr:MAG: hypothetical protein DWQ04_32560 [Chloroflexota bacterium]
MARWFTGIPVIRFTALCFLKGETKIIQLPETQKPPKGLRAEEEKKKRGEGGKCLFCYVENIIQGNLGYPCQTLYI